MADTERTRREQLAIENARKDAAAVNMGKAYERSLTNTAPAPKEAASAPAKPPAKKACGGKVKGYAEGGVTEGENKNIDDDTRMRARAAIARRMAGEEDEAPPVKRSAPKAVSKPGPSGRPRDNASQGGTKARFNVSQGGTKADNLKQRRMKDFLSYQEMQRNMPEETSPAARDAIRRNLESTGRDYEAASYDGMKSGGKVKAYAKGGSVRGGGCESRGKTKGRFI